MKISVISLGDKVTGSDSVAVCCIFMMEENTTVQLKVNEEQASPFFPFKFMAPGSYTGIPWESMGFWDPTSIPLTFFFSSVSFFPFCLFQVSSLLLSVHLSHLFSSLFSCFFYLSFLLSFSSFPPLLLSPFSLSLNVIPFFPPPRWFPWPWVTSLTRNSPSPTPLLAIYGTGTGTGTGALSHTQGVESHPGLHCIDQASGKTIHLKICPWMFLKQMAESIKKCPFHHTYSMCWLSSVVFVGKIACWAMNLNFVLLMSPGNADSLDGRKDQTTVWGWSQDGFSIISWNETWAQNVTTHALPPPLSEHCAPDIGLRRLALFQYFPFNSYLPPWGREHHQLLQKEEKSEVQCALSLSQGHTVSKW